MENAKTVSEQTMDKEQFLAEYFSYHPKSKRPGILTKREKKKFGIGRDEGRASVKYYRIAPRKARIVLNLIKNKSLDEALGIIKYTPKAASDVIYKLLKSAEANAVNNNGLDRDLLYVSEAYADQGPTMKRLMPRARGSANIIKKRTSHITVVLKERK